MSTYCCGCLSLVNQSELLTSLERRLNRLKELKWERISLVDIWYVAVEACLGVIVG